MLTISNFSYAGTQKYVSHAVMLSFTKEPKTLCGMDVYQLLNRAGQEWEVQETNEPHSVGCVKCLRLLTKRAGDGATCPRCRGVLNNDGYCLACGYPFPPRA